jgi:hypothetical protein
MADLCSHVKMVEKEYWQWDNLMDVTVDSMIIHFGENSDCTSKDEGVFWSVKMNAGD